MSARLLLLALIVSLPALTTACGSTNPPPPAVETAAPGTTVPTLDYPDEPGPPPADETGTADPTGRDGRCGARTRNTCPPDQFCAFLSPICDHADATGFCQDFPTSCGAAAPKVCSCSSGASYPDVCAAKQAGERKIVLNGCP